MASPYSQDFRDRVLGAYDRQMRTKDIAEVFQISPSWARRLKQRRRENGETSPRPMGGKRFEKIDRARLAELVKEQPDATLSELRERLGVVCGQSAISMALKRMGLSFKKRRSTPRSRTGRMSPSVARPGSRIRPASTRAV